MKQRKALMSERLIRPREDTEIEVRGVNDGRPPMITGYAAVFNQPSVVMNGHGYRFREVIKPGTFTKTLAGNTDVVALFNHDPNFVLGRRSANTLRVWQDTKGLGYEIAPSSARWVQELMESIARGDIRGSSFSFGRVKSEDGQTRDDDGKAVDLISLTEVRLFDVGPVTMPAYPATDGLVDIRSLLATGFDIEHLIQRAVEQRLASLAPGATEASAPTPPAPALAELPVEPAPPARSLVATGEYDRWLERHLKYLDDPRAA
jgi:HK97 family phage prohead protease